MSNSYITTIHIKYKKYENHSSIDLFDFEKNQIIEESDVKHEVNKEKKGFIIVSNSNINSLEFISHELLLNSKIKNKNENILFQIEFHNKNKTNIALIKNMIDVEKKNKLQMKKLTDRPWKVVNKGECLKISIGDVVKLGKVRLKLQRIYMKNKIEDVSNKENKLNIKTQNTLTDNILGTISSTYINQNESNCRVCFNQDSDINNPLLIPCSCSGTMTYIHYLCLKRNIKSRLSLLTEDSCIFLTWSHFNCEICLSEYPRYIKYMNLMYSLIDVPHKFEEYLQFDYKLHDDKLKKSVLKGVILIGIQNKSEVLIGRTNKNMVKFKEVSVSREHCSLLIKNNDIFIKNFNSKYGTLVYSYDPVELYDSNDKAEFFIKNYIIQIGIEKTFSIYNFVFCCQAKEENEEENEQDMFFSKCQIKKDSSSSLTCQSMMKKRSLIDEELYNKDDSVLDYCLRLENIIMYQEKDEDASTKILSSFI